MTSLFHNISHELPSITGWCTEEKAIMLASAVVMLRPAVTVEIGVWGGRSLIPMAMAHKAIGYGRIIGIDPWSARASVQGQEREEDTKWWSDQSNHEKVYSGFMSHIKRLDLDSSVIILRSASDDVDPPEVIDLWHCDGNHGPQAIRDVERFAPKIRVGGIAFMDDVDWSGGAVGKACEKMVAMGFIPLYRLGTGMVLQRVK